MVSSIINFKTNKHESAIDRCLVNEKWIKYTLFLTQIKCILWLRCTFQQYMACICHHRLVSFRPKVYLSKNKCKSGLKKVLLYKFWRGGRHKVCYSLIHKNIYMLYGFSVGKRYCGVDTGLHTWVMWCNQAKCIKTCKY